MPHLTEKQLRDLTRRAMREGIHHGIQFTIQEFSHAVRPMTRERLDRAYARISWLLERVDGDEPISLRQLDQDLPRVNGTPINADRPDR